MSKAFIVSAFASLVIASSSLIGCGGDDASDPSSSSSSSAVTLKGNIGGGSAGTGTRTFGNVNIANGPASLHVSARELHARNSDSEGRNVDVAVAADGSFKIDVSRGSRWVVTVDDANGRSAIITFGNGSSAISVRADGGEGGTVDVGNVHIVGGQARSSVTITGAYGLEATAIALDEVFLAADGAIVAAEEAVKDAEKAAQAALAAADDALDAAAEAQKRAEEAAAAAQAAAGKH